jgi:hypothetical protein
VYITGFDFAGTTNKSQVLHHYYGNKLLETVLKDDKHDVQLEYEMVKRLVVENKVEYLNLNTTIEKSDFMGKRAEYNCTKCNKMVVLYDWEQPICSYCEESLIKC